MLTPKCITRLLCTALIAFAVTLQGAEPFNGIAFDPAPDPFTPSAIDLRMLNEKFAGEHGFIAASGDAFIRSGDREVVRFWAVNGPPHDLRDVPLQQCARRLAKYGVNLARMHGAIFTPIGEPDLKKITQLQHQVSALKAEGIYSHLSIYFPLWMTPSKDHPWLRGYDGQKHPFAALMFNREFQEHYRSWWKALLTTPDKQGHRLVDEPALFGVELQNEDSFFFWTFNSDQIPSPQLELLETQFGSWLTQKYGSLEAAVRSWNGLATKRDALASGRMGFRPLWNLSHEKTARDRDTARFLFETQQRFYTESIAFLRSLGFKGLITPSNWATASPEVLGPLEKWSYTSGDFVDRHGYFSVAHKGDNAEWSIRNGHTYTDRSALRFEGSAPGQPRQFVHPSMDITYDNKPSMISETTWNRPNRYRSEAPLYFACYGAMQGTDAIVHFALDGDRWSVKPGFWMQPWTLMSPSQMAQFPAAALLYRKGFVKTASVLARVTLNTNDLLNLKGTPAPQDASFDELRLKDVPRGTELRGGQRLDPLIHYAGRVSVNFTNGAANTQLTELSPFINHATHQVRSATDELFLDYGKGLFTIQTPEAQGASGNLRAGGEIALKDVVIRCDLDNAHIVVVSLDGQPLASSGRMLLQVMSEEQPSDFATEALADGTQKILNIGRDPWRIRAIQGEVEMKGSTPTDIQALDFNGYPVGNRRHATLVKLSPETIYYLLTRSDPASAPSK